MFPYSRSNIRLQAMIRESAGAELCASPGSTNPKPSDCVKAVDRTYKGDVDLSDRVVVGEPVQKSSLQWSVPYNVKDDAGNEAATVWRDVVVQEVDLSSVENLIRAEVTREQEAAQQRAIQKAIREEKAKWEREQVNNRRPHASKQCPACPPCNCPDTPQTTKESCAEYCENVSKSCSFKDENFVYYLLFWMEYYLSPSLVPVILSVTLIFLVFLILRFILTTIYNPKTYRSHSSYRGYGPSDEMILRSPQPTGESSPAPPRQSMSTLGNNNAGGESIFSPGRQPGFASPSFAANNGTPRNRPAEPMYDESIYMSSPIITPSKTGDGARRRNL